MKIREQQKESFYRYIRTGSLCLLVCHAEACRSYLVLTSLKVTVRLSRIQEQ